MKQQEIKGYQEQATEAVDELVSEINRLREELEEIHDLAVDAEKALNDGVYEVGDRITEATEVFDKIQTKAREAQA